jgi:hypothetical protein
VVSVRIAAALAGALLMGGGCSWSYCSTATCEARELVDALATRPDALGDRRSAFEAVRQRLQLSPCPDGHVPLGTLCASRTGGGRTTELRAALEPGAPHESRYTLGLAAVGKIASLEIPGLGPPFGHTLSDEPGWVLAGGVLLIRPVAQTLAWISPGLVGDPLDRLEADPLAKAPRWGDIRLFLAVQSRWRDEGDLFHPRYQFSPRADDRPGETTTIGVDLRASPGGRAPDDATRVDAVRIVATRDHATLDPTWVAAWLRDLHFYNSLPALEAASREPPTPECVRAAKHGNFAVTWSVQRQGPLHVHTITAARRLYANDRFVAEPFNLCPEARGVFAR